MYRPTAPSVRAQSIQVVQAAHASAVRGHEVTLCVQAARSGVTATEVLAFYGLKPISGLDLRVLPVSNTPASVAFRAAFAAWAIRGGTAIARSKKYAAEALKWVPGRFELVIEAHEVDSDLAIERGEDPAEWLALERTVLAAAKGVICNCEGTRDRLLAAHGERETAVLHNATHPSRIRHPSGPGAGIGYTGSLRAAKDSPILAEVARRLESAVVVVGPERDPALVEQSGGWLSFEDALAHHALPDRLARFEILALPVGDGLFGRELTSPLKLWDYLAVGRPIVAADTRAIRAAAGEAFEPYPPGDADGFVAAVRRLRRDPALVEQRVAAGRERVRTWDQRAAELDVFLDRVLP